MFWLYIATVKVGHDRRIRLLIMVGLLETVELNCMVAIEVIVGATGNICPVAEWRVAVKVKRAAMVKMTAEMVVFVGIAVKGMCVAWKKIYESLIIEFRVLHLSFFTCWHHVDHFVWHQHFSRLLLRAL